MKWKAWFSVVFFGVLIWGGPVDTWAGEKELIQLLIKKNIITQDEADQLLKESKSSAVKEKTEIKKEVKTEIEEDLKKDVAKGEFLPPALKGFKFGTTIYAEWNAINRFNGISQYQPVCLEPGLCDSDQGFQRLVGDEFHLGPFYGSRTPMMSNNGLELRIKYAFVDLRLLGTESMMGMIPTPSDYYDSAIWPYRVQGHNFLDDQNIQSTADLGVVNMGVIGGYMDEDYLKYAAKPFAGKWGGYMIGVYSGAGFDAQENNQQ